MAYSRIKVLELQGRVKGMSSTSEGSRGVTKGKGMAQTKRGTKSRSVDSGSTDHPIDCEVFCTFFVCPLSVERKLVQFFVCSVSV
jgi:hypothetical protein